VIKIVIKCAYCHQAVVWRQIDITLQPEIARELLAQPGCTCAASQREDSRRWSYHRHHVRQLAEHGHLFGSTSISHGIPNEPHHDYSCPARVNEQGVTP
jgi:hypothetical protein